MSAFENIVTPIIQMLVYIGLLGGLAYGLYWLKTRFFNNLFFYVKYKILKRTPVEEDVKFCLDMIEMGEDDDVIMKASLLAGNSLNKTRELMYILRDIKKNVKGGKENDR